VRKRLCISFTSKGNLTGPKSGPKGYRKILADKSSKRLAQRAQRAQRAAKHAKKFKNRDSGLTPNDLELLFLVSLLSLACFASLRTLREILECFFGFEVIRHYPLGPQLGYFHLCERKDFELYIKRQFYRTQKRA